MHSWVPPPLVEIIGLSIKVYQFWGMFLENVWILGPKDVILFSFVDYHLGRHPCSNNASLSMPNIAKMVYKANHKYLIIYNAETYFIIYFNPCIQVIFHKSFIISTPYK